MNQSHLFAVFSDAVQARLHCLSSNANESQAGHVGTWDERIEQLLTLMPSGSGWDMGTKIDLDASHATKLVFYGEYHHMNDGGYYDGWTAHTITVTPSFHGINIRVSGRNRNDIKDYLAETFDYALCTYVVWNAEKGYYEDARYAGQNPAAIVRDVS
jgi:hypothetical protein